VLYIYWKYPEAIEYLKQTRGYLENPDFVKWISDGVHSGYGTIDVSGNGHFRMLGESKVKEYCTGKGTFTMIQSPTTRYEQVIIIEGIHDAISVVHYKLAEDIIIPPLSSRLLLGDGSSRGGLIIVD